MHVFYSLIKQQSFRLLSFAGKSRDHRKWKESTWRKYTLKNCVSKLKTNESNICRCLNNWQTNSCFVLCPGVYQSMFSSFYKFVQTVMTFYCFVHLTTLIKMRSGVKRIQKYFHRKNLQFTCLYLYCFRNIFQLKNRYNKNSFSGNHLFEKK